LGLRVRGREKKNAEEKRNQGGAKALKGKSIGETSRKVSTTSERKEGAIVHLPRGEMVS